MSRDEEWLGNTVRKAVTVEECQLAVSIFLAERAGLPLVKRGEQKATIRLVHGEPTTRREQ